MKRGDREALRTWYRDRLVDLEARCHASPTPEDTRLLAWYAWRYQALCWRRGYDTPEMSGTSGPEGAGAWGAFEVATTATSGVKGPAATGGGRALAEATAVKVGRSSGALAGEPGPRVE